MLYRRYVKGMLDISAAFFLVLIFSWLFVIIFFMYAILWEFPIFFKQERIGKNNIPFSMWKFKTLSADDRLPATERIFAWGKFLRMTSLDELPQLWNILKGEMSLIGPRPLPGEYLPLYSHGEIRRHDVKPGITGWAQVNGRNALSWQKKFELDLFYVNNLSFKLDMVTLLKTFALILSFKEDVSLTEEKFRGH